MMLNRFPRSDADIKKHQINTLKIFNDNVTEINEGEEYEVSFNSGGNSLVLKVILSLDFPQDKPTLKIVPPVIHAWINVDGEVKSAPGLLNFTVHSDLGRVVQAIIRELQRTPPPLVSNSTVVSPSIPIINGEFRSSPVIYQNVPSVSSFSPPLYMPQPRQFQSAAFPELQELSLDELKFLNEDSERLDEFLDNLPMFKEQNKTLEDLVGHIEELAELNLSKEEKLSELRLEVDSRIEEVTKLAFENERLFVCYQNISDKYAPRNIKDELKIAAQEADTESEKIAESFLSGEIDVDKFLTDFIKTKTLSQTRKTKEEKLGEQIDKLERAGF